MNRLIKLKSKGNEDRSCGRYRVEAVLPEDYCKESYSEIMPDAYLRTLREIKCLLGILVIIVLITALFKKG